MRESTARRRAVSELCALLNQSRAQLHSSSLPAPINPYADKTLGAADLLEMVRVAERHGYYLQTPAPAWPSRWRGYSEWHLPFKTKETSTITVALLVPNSTVSSIRRAW